MIVGTAGHIDHGKTSLVRALTGVETDRLPEEKRRGITIELGFAPLELPGGQRAGVVDVPGHEGFIRTMVAGATGVDLGLLVIAADEGVMPQTREHLAILELLGIGALVVAVTKCDLVDAEWLALVRDDITQLLAPTPYQAAPLVDVSVRTGHGLDELRRTLADALASVARRAADDLFRLPIDRAFTVRGTGTVVTGTSWSGSIEAASDVRLYPGGRAVRVRALQSHGSAVERAGPGARLAVALAGVDLADVHRGMTLASAAPWEAVTHFHAAVRLADSAESFRPREWIRLHVATTEVSARVVEVGATRLARIITEEPVVLRAGDRFVLRRSQPLSTVGGGIVVDPAPGRRRARPSVGWLPSLEGRFEALLAAVGEEGTPVAALPIRIGCTPTDARLLAQRPANAIPWRDVIYPRPVVDRLRQAVVAEVLAFHASHGTEAGAPLSVGRRQARSDALADLVVQEAVRAGELELRGGVVCRPGWAPALDDGQRALSTQLMAILMEAGREPPSVAELERSHPGQPLGAVATVLRFLEKQGTVVAVEPDRYYAAASLGTLLADLVSNLEGADGAVSPAQLREHLGMSRKFLMPFLEFCDRERIAERREEGRVLAAQGRARLATFLDTLEPRS